MRLCRSVFVQACRRSGFLGLADDKLRRTDALFGCPERARFDRPERRHGADADTT